MPNKVCSFNNADSWKLFIAEKQFGVEFSSLEKAFPSAGLLWYNSTWDFYVRLIHTAQRRYTEHCRIKGGGISRQAVWTARTRAWNPSSKSPCPSAFLCFSAAPSFLFPPSLRPPLGFSFLHCWRVSCVRGDTASKCLPQTLPYTAHLLLTSFIFFLILFLPSIP